MKKILFVGDSTYVGWGAGDTNYYNNSFTASLPQKVADGLNAAGVTTNSSSLIGTKKWGSLGNLEAADSRVDTASFVEFNDDALGGRIFEYRTGSAMSLSATGDTAYIYLCMAPGNGIGRWRVDGGSWSSPYDTDAALGLNKVEIPLGSPGTHTIEVDKDPTSPNNKIYVCGLEVLDSTKQCNIVTIAANGYQASNYVSTTYPWHTYYALASVDCDAIIFNTGINDVLQSVSEANYETRYSNFITQFASDHPSAQLFFAIPNDISVGLSYVPVSVADLAVSHSATVIDTRDATNFSDYATANGAGLMDDGNHPNATGYENIADEYVTQILANITFPSPGDPTNTPVFSSAFNTLFEGLAQ